MRVRRSTPSGFSLLELSVVIAIIALVGGMSMSIGKTMLDVAEIKGSQEHLELAREALQLFHKKHNRYPCPALETDNAANNTYGVEQTGCASACPLGLTCSGNAVIGFLPFRALGINEEAAYDSWDGRITYIIDKTHTVLSEYGLGSLVVHDSAGNEITASPALGDAIFVLVSHGKDGNGAYSKNGVLIKACGATAKDIANCDGDDISMDSRINNSEVTANYFDDYVLWQTQENMEPAPPTPTYDFSFSCGFAQCCDGKSNGSVWCWGWGTRGELGNGVYAHSSTPVAVTGVSGANGAVSGIQADSGGCLIKTDKTVWCWGSSTDNAVPGVMIRGRIGNGSLVDAPAPAQVSGLTGIVKMNAGESASCAIKTDGTLWCWGKNQYGEVGDGTTTERDTPVQVATLGNDVEDVWAGDGKTCAIKKSNRTLWCWGSNQYGQLGDNTTTDRSVPVQVSTATGLTTVSAVRPDNTHTCAIKTDGSLWCWGFNPDGEVGDGTLIERHVPAAVSTATGLTGISAVASGWYLTCAIKTDKTVWCWGKGDMGEMGDGTTNSYSQPHQVPGLTNATEIAVGDVSGCAKKSDGTIWCWGRNDVGQLGDGTTTDRLSPVQVLNFP